jgi:Ca-activated chloride channel family protein
MRQESSQFQQFVRFFSLAAALLIAFVSAWPAAGLAQRGKPLPPPTAVHPDPQGCLISLDSEGRPTQLFPLKHTDVKIEISGFLARARVTQQFENPFPDKIEAVYTFPLPQQAAVDDMTLTVGDRVVKAKIKKREDAKAIYEAARARGHVAGLLDQERPNIFTQSVANIMPGEKITVTISYVETLKYEDGSYELLFPMVVGPRYIPGQPTGTSEQPSTKLGGDWAYDTDQVPDASRITPSVAKPGTRAGHDISIDLQLDAGLPLESLQSRTHDVTIEKPAPDRAVVRLKNQATIPNKDFILRYDVAGKKIGDAVLTHRNGQSGHDGFFTLILQPPDRVTPAEVTPKELIFVLDTSGSMSGFPIEKAKETMNLALEGLNPNDTFNLITFSGDTHILFPEPVPATKEDLRKAQAFLKSRAGGGGTEMMKAIRAALDPSDSQKHVRIVCFMTDGYVGNDMEIIAEVQKHPNARVFSFGIGSSVNRFLLDKMAEQGRGEVEYVGLNDDGSAAARRFHERVQNPLLTDISVDWGALKVTEVYPQRLQDLFSAKPVVLTGRYVHPGKGTITLHGKLAGRPVTREIRVELPETQPQHDVLATLWARTRIEDLTARDYSGIQQGTAKPEVRLAITQLGLDYRLLTQYTSFVAVEEMTITEGGQPRRIDVPVEIPEGVSYEGIFGGRGEVLHQVPMLNAAAPPMGSRGGFIGKTMERRAFSEADAPVDLLREGKPDLSLKNESAKLHRSLAAVLNRLKEKNQTPSPDEISFVKNGKAEVQVWLTDTTDETLAQLEKLGFEMVLKPKPGKLVIGRMPIDKLAALTELKAVRYIVPQIEMT